MPRHVGIYAQYEPGEFDAVRFLMAYQKAVAAFERANQIFLRRVAPGKTGLRYKLYGFDTGSLFSDVFPSHEGEDVDVAQKSSFSLFDVFDGVELPDMQRLISASDDINKEMSQFALIDGEIVNPEILLSDALKVAKLLKGFPDGHKVLIAANDECVSVSGIARVNEYYVDDILYREESFEVRQAQTLEVKKPEYIDRSAWSFVYEGRVIVAKIMNEEWLQGFQRGHISVPPGTKLVVDLIVSKMRSIKGKGIKEKFAVKEIGGVV